MRLHIPRVQHQNEWSYTPACAIRLHGVDKDNLLSNFDLERGKCMDLQEVNCGGGGMDWIDLALERGSWPALVNAVMKLRVPLNAGNFLTG